MPYPASPLRHPVRVAVAALGIALGLHGAAQAEAFPRLLPLDELLSEDGRPERRLAPENVSPLLERATRLRLRAEAVRARVPLDPDTRARIAAMGARVRD